MTLSEYNQLSKQEATQAILPTNGSRQWAQLMTAQRPYLTEDDLFAAADRLWRDLPEADQQEAFDSHPRIGERHAHKRATNQSLQWSQQEQTLSEEETTRQALVEANLQYEKRFGRIFIVCASGKSQEQMLAILQHRLQNDAQSEREETAEQQRQITQLRLRKWLSRP
jgi:2-oxo-4-hydroxy-4-carboxy-5-ureidoimidazoline decarboxylase